MTFSEMPSCGIWEDRPQLEYEHQEILEQLKDLSYVKYLCESGVTYGIWDSREDT